MLGFSQGNHVSHRLTVQGYFSPHIRFTRLALSIQHPNNKSASSASPPDSWASTSLRPPSSTGFVDHTPEQGMSGGAVVDMKCRLWGITERQSVNGMGGQFVRMTKKTVARIDAAVDAFYSLAVTASSYFSYGS